MRIIGTSKGKILQIEFDNFDGISERGADDGGSSSGSKNLCFSSMMMLLFVHYYNIS